MASLPTSAELQAGRACAGTPGASLAGQPSSSATPKISAPAPKHLPAAKFPPANYTAKPSPANPN
eukprot:616155-Alexandrium_andersonii.AAC.1